MEAYYKCATKLKKAKLIFLSKSPCHENMRHQKIKENSLCLSATIQLSNNAEPQGCNKHNNSSKTIIEINDGRGQRRAGDDVIVKIITTRQALTLLRGGLASNKVVIIAKASEVPGLPAKTPEPAGY